MAKALQNKISLRLIIQRMTINRFSYNSTRNCHSSSLSQDINKEGIIALFPGQGSQYVGMISNETASRHIVRNLYDRASAVLGYDILKVTSEGPKSALDSTIYCQPAVVLASLAAYEIAKEDRPDLTQNIVAAAGFSVGEFTALIVSGAMSLEDAMTIVNHRAQAMQNASDNRPTGMLTTIGLSLERNMHVCDDVVNEIIGKDGILQVANILFPDCYVLAGDLKGLDYIQSNYRKLGFRRVKRLPVSGAFHTIAMASAQSLLEEVLPKVTVLKPSYDVYSNVTGKPYRSIISIIDLLPQQIVEPVLWHQIIVNMHSRFPKCNWHEFGPGTQLTSTINKIVTKSS